MRRLEKRAFYFFIQQSKYIEDAGFNTCHKYYQNFWNARYFPALIEVEKTRYPTIEFIKKSLFGNSGVILIPVPFNRVDGFQEAFYGRPEAFATALVFPVFKARSIPLEEY
ncbi:MAG: hypothetical protein JWM28_3334 [Chitinophagaceae bacterium]|nr:hypothetical protein [Chitinophagaceae bacterium]